MRAVIISFFLLTFPSLAYADVIASSGDFLNFPLQLLLSIFIETVILIFLVRKLFKINADILSNKILIICGIVCSAITLSFIFLFGSLEAIQGLWGILVSELSATLIEAFVISFLLKFKFGRSLVLSFICNLSSFFIGLFVLSIMFPSYVSRSVHKADYIGEQFSPRWTQNYKQSLSKQSANLSSDFGQQMASNQTIPIRFRGSVRELSPVNKEELSKAHLIMDENPKWKLIINITPPGAINNAKTPIREGINNFYIDDIEAAFGEKIDQISGEYNFSLTWYVMVPGKKGFGNFKATKIEKNNPNE